MECELRSLLIFGRLDLLSLSYCTAEYLLFCILRTLHQLVYIDIYIYWIRILAHSSTVCHPYHSDAPNTYRQPVSLSEAPLIFGIADDLCSMQKHFSISVPSPVYRSNSSLDRMSLCCLIMSKIAMVFVTCNRPTAILLCHRGGRFLLDGRYLHCISHQFRFVFYIA